MKRLSILAGILSLSSSVFGADSVYPENALIAGVDFKEQEEKNIPYSFYYPYQYEYYYPETSVDEEAIENSERSFECPCQKKIPEKKKKKPRRRS